MSNKPYSTFKVAQNPLIPHPDRQLRIGWPALCLNQLSDIEANKTSDGSTEATLPFESQIVAATSQHYHAGRMWWEDGGEHFKKPLSVLAGGRLDPSIPSRLFPGGFMQSVRRWFSSFFAFLGRGGLPPFPSNSCVIPVRGRILSMDWFLNERTSTFKHLRATRTSTGAGLRLLIDLPCELK